MKVVAALVLVCGGTVMGCGGTSPPVAPAPAGPPATLTGRLQIQPAAHCGGARVRPDAVVPPLAPAPGVTLVLHPGERNRTEPPIAELTTSADGTFQTTVPAGRYCLVLQKGTKPTQGDRWNELSCLVTEWERCDAIVDVPTATPVVIDVLRRCFSPCYRGPPPP